MTRLILEYPMLQYSFNFCFKMFFASLEHIQFTNILFTKGIHQSWEHIPPQQ